MYVYDEFDKSFIQQRTLQFRNQVERRLAGELSEDQFKPLRLQNGLYLQLHAYMLRVAIPYGVLSSNQLRGLADISEKYDRGYGHFTTRQNIQFNWVKLSELPELMDDLAALDMHAVQTSGNCIRNITSDPFAGVAADEFTDPRPLCEVLRQWSSAHPEFGFLPRKFKLAIVAAKQDRAAIKVHDIGIKLVKAENQDTRYEIWVGGGQGRTPKVAQLLFKDIPLKDLLATLESTLRVYNLQGRRDNKYKARIKILVNAMGLETFKSLVLDDLSKTQAQAPVITEQQLTHIANRFQLPDYTSGIPASSPEDLSPAADGFRQWINNNVYSHKQNGYKIVVVSLKPLGGIPGDANADQMRHLAELAESFSFGEIRVTKNQNLVLPHVKESQLRNLFNQLAAFNLHSGNVGLVSDITACPGLDYCGLATARSIPVAQTISQLLMNTEKEAAIGKVKINISGCINACGHHHVADIGILGLDKRDTEFYQISIGGRDDEAARIGQIVGPGFSADEIPIVVDRILDIYLQNRIPEETFSETVSRLGHDFFKEKIYVSNAA